MKSEICDPIEIHMICVAKYQKSSVNIVVRARLDTVIDKDTLETAVQSFVEKHPYLRAKYYGVEDSSTYRYYYEEISDEIDNTEVRSISRVQVDNIINTLSPLRTYLFDYAQGELFKVIVHNSPSESVIELAVSHIVCEVPSTIILLGDLLRFCEKESRDNKIFSTKKYIFREEDFSWEKQKYVKPEEDFLNAGVQKNNPWNIPQATLKRHHLSKSLYKQIKNWLDKNNIQAKPSDVFYYAAYHALKEILELDPEMWLIQNYRTRATSLSLKKAIYNFALVGPVFYDRINDKTDKDWLESFYKYRESLLSQSGVHQMRNYFYWLNKAMEDKSIEEGVDIMNRTVKFPMFAFNNFGNIDEYIGKLQSICIKDIEIQDGTPMQEIRYFTYQDTLYFNPTFFSGTGVDISDFWIRFKKHLTGIVKGSSSAGYIIEGFELPE